jgi:prepilin-type N-terminal cleavage/methylation domain-containing protein
MNKLKNTKWHGFTIVEMAVVLVIIGTLMSAGLKIATSVLSSNTSTVTNQNISIIKQSLINFLRSNGRLPCPDIAVPPTGIEPPACPANNDGYGVIPWATLGLTRDIALDGFSNFITYRVSNSAMALIQVALPNAAPSAYDANQRWTSTLTANPTFSILSITPKNLPAASNGYKTIEIQQKDAAGGVTTITYNAIVVLYSHGKNGAGARTTKGTLIAAPTGADEITNNANGSVTFITKPAVDVTASAGGAYDDVIAYMTPQDLLQPLLNDKTLIGTCKAYCGTPATGCVPTGIPIGVLPANCP